jgi:hypothetical protein
VVDCATWCAHCGDIAIGDFAIQDALSVSWRENLNWREKNKSLFLVNGCNPMDAAAPLNLDALGLDADQLTALQRHIAALRNAAEVLAAPPPLFGPGAAPSQPRAAAPVHVQGVGDAPGEVPAPPVREPPSRRGRGRPRGAKSRRPALDAPRAPQRRRASGGGAGDADSQVSGTDDDDENGIHVDAEEDVDDLYFDEEVVPPNSAEPPFVWEEVQVQRAVLRDLRSGEREESTLPPFNKGPTAPKNVPGDCTSAFSILKLLLNESIIDRMCEYTNAYANESAYANTRRAQRWRDVEPAEMWVWISCVIFIGVCKINNRECAWDRSSPFFQPWLASKMSLERFEAIARCLHTEAPWRLSDADKAARNQQDAFWQIDAFATELSDNFTSHVDIGQCIDLDECTCGYRGRHRCRCFNPAKPHKYHFKQFCLNCSVTGYILSFYWYRGKSEHRPPNMPATLFPLVQLVNRVNSLTRGCLSQGGHVIATDNWYTSLHSAKFLYENNMHSVGTIRINRLSAADPPRTAFFARQGGNRDRGTFCCHKVSKGDNFCAYLTPWHDNKPVHILHSFPTRVSTCLRNQKLPQCAHYEKKRLDRPTIYRDYNQIMGGTDLNDWLLAQFRSSFRSRRWQPKVLTHMLQQAVVNAHIIFKLKNGLGRERTLFHFVQELVKEIPDFIRRPPVLVPQGRPDLPDNSQSRWWWSCQSARRTTGSHVPDLVTRPRDDDQRRPENRKRCKYCVCVRTSLYCSNCQVFLCGGACWHAWHSLRELPSPEEMRQEALEPQGDE